MTDQARAKSGRVHGNTKKAADTALMKRTISPDSHRAVLAGELSMEEARSLGRNAGPSGPAVRADKDDRTPTPTPCLCGCGLMVPRRFAPGHDARMFRVAREHLTEGRELTDEQTEYLYESGKLERVGARLAEEERERHERAAKKAGK